MTCRQIRQGLIHLFGSAADEEDPAQPKRLHVGRPGTVGPSLLAPGVPHRSSPPKTQNRIGNNRGGSLIRCPARTPPRLSFFSFHSAMCWFFGRDVFNALQSPRPIGLIETNVGGTPDQHCERKGPRSPPPFGILLLSILAPTHSISRVFQGARRTPSTRARARRSGTGVGPHRMDCPPAGWP